MEIKPVKTKRDHKRALAEIERLMQARKNTPEGDRLEVLVTLVSAYEDRHFRIDTPNPIEAIKFRMDQMGMSRKDLEPLIGSRGRVSEILNGSRPLSLSMIRNLNKSLSIPAEILIQETVQ